MNVHIRHLLMSPGRCGRNKVDIIQFPHGLCKRLTLGLGHVNWTKFVG